MDLNKQLLVVLKGHETLVHILAGDGKHWTACGFSVTSGDREAGTMDIQYRDMCEECLG